jgi:hypothetical protein
MNRCYHTQTRTLSDPASFCSASVISQALALLERGMAINSKGVFQRDQSNMLRNRDQIGAACTGIDLRKCHWVSLAKFNLLGIEPSRSF